MVLSGEHPKEILYRSLEPALAPLSVKQRHGSSADVVFPTGIDRRNDIGEPHRYDVYFGVDDFSISVARLDLPDTLPTDTEGDLA
jgi:predicted GH43/DUF377 family glycosyl hydrolase